MNPDEAEEMLRKAYFKSIGETERGRLVLGKFEYGKADATVIKDDYQRCIEKMQEEIDEKTTALGALVDKCCNPSLGIDKSLVVVIDDEMADVIVKARNAFDKWNNSA
jgi:hypothetical protein